MSTVASQEEQFGRFGTLRSVWVAVSFSKIHIACFPKVCTPCSMRHSMQRKPPGFAFGESIQPCRSLHISKFLGWLT